MLFRSQALETKAKFIAQVLTGDSTVRQADDIGAQELSYAEVKAIASGNPAVLTLAEADAALHRAVRSGSILGSSNGCGPTTTSRGRACSRPLMPRLYTLRPLRSGIVTTFARCSEQSVRGRYNKR